MCIWFPQNKDNSGNDKAVIVMALTLQRAYSALVILLTAIHILSPLLLSAPSEVGGTILVL